MKSVTEDLRNTSVQNVAVRTALLVSHSIITTMDVLLVMAVLKMNFEGKTYEEIKESVKKDLEAKKMIALPGGTYCWFCKKEICMDMSHGNRVRLQLAINKLIRDLEELRREQK